MRRLLGVLRRDDDPRALAPQPGLAQLDELIGADASVAGCRARLRAVRPAALTPGIDLVAYRVVEAALGAGGRPTAVASARDPDPQSGPRALNLEVTGRWTRARS